MQIKEFQGIISEKYEKRDRERGIPATFMWFVEEVGELATALSGNDHKNKEEEFADVFAWLCALSSDPTDITQNGANGEGIRFGMMLADLIRAAAIQHAGRRILQSQNINRITMLSAESVNDIMMHQAEIYQSGIKYMARETPHWANDCLECLNDKTISKNAILR